MPHTPRNTPPTFERFYKSLLLASSLLAFGYLIVSAFWENYFADWRYHQRAYRDLLAEVADDDNSRRIARSFRLELQQAVLPEIGHVDRCLTCHIGVDNPKMQDAEEPYGFHPSPYLDDHPIGTFGCTICHRGQGLAVVSEEAKRDEYWNDWMLPVDYTQASCGLCHDPLAIERDGARRLANGYRLYGERGCPSCHRLGNRGSNFGPSLDNVGRKNRHFFPMARVQGDHTVENWLYEHFLDPQEIVPQSRMKKAQLTEDEARDLTVYMLSLQAVSLPESYLAADKYRSLFERRYPPLASGEDLYNEFCFGCHEESVFGDEDVILGKEIPAIRNPYYLSRISDASLALVIRRGRPGTEMPAWSEDAGGLREEEIQAIVEYLAESREFVSDETFVPLEPSDVEAGRILYDEYCLDCHGEEGRGDSAPSLADPVFQEVYDDRLLGLTIRDGIDDTGMVSFREDGLSDQEISDIMAYIRTLR